MDDGFGKTYYIDLDGITEKCRIGPKETKKTGKQKSTESFDDTPTINVFKFELIKMCIDRVLDEFPINLNDPGGISSFRTGENAGENSLSFQIAFNTLLKNEILIEYEYE